MTGAGAAPGDGTALTDPDFPLVVFGDFICPWSYAVLGVVDRLAAGHGLRPWWRPHLLRPDTPPEGTPYEDLSHRDATVAWLKEVAPEESARMVWPERVAHSMLAFQGLEYADDHRRGWAYAEAVFDALWVQGADIGRPAVLQAAGARAGLDPDDLGRALSSDHYRRRTLAAADQTRRLEVTATPTLIVGRTRVNGWHYLEALEAVVAKQRPSERT